MTSFFSFFKKHILPPRPALRTLLRRPLTWYGIVLWIFIIAIAAIIYTMILRINSRSLVTIPQRGGTVTEGMIGAPHLINPITATTQTDLDISALIYSGLMKKSLDGSLAFDLAASDTVSADGRTYTFTLKPNLKWSDGKPLQSSDIAFTMQKLADPALHSDPFWQSVTVSTPNPQTVVFTLPAANPDFLAATTVGILPAHLWQGVSDAAFDTASENMHPIGSGPYRLERTLYSGDGVPSLMYLRINSHYALARPYITHYTLAFFANQQLLFDALTNGTVTMTFAANPTTATALRRSDFAIEKVASTTVVGLFHRQSDAAISDALLSIVSRSIDKGALLATVENGYGIPVDETTPLLSVADGTSALQSLGLVQQNGVLEKKGVPVTFSIAVENDPELLLSAYTLADQLQSLGITATIKAFDTGTFRDALQTNEYPFFIGAIRDNDIPSGYEPAVLLYTKAYPFIFTRTLHATPPSVLTTPSDRYSAVTSWYLRTDRVWKIVARSLSI